MASSQYPQERRREMAFPRGFLFGAATSAYQIEGRASEDGRGRSWWDDFAKTGGHTADGSDGDIACDHYRLWKEDVALMATLGLKAYRFSISWPRVLPKGRGRENAKGLDFYDRLVDGLLERGIIPYATLYHWDLPSALAEEGGWINRDCAKAFEEFADKASRRLGDRVHSWATLNEPRCASVVGYVEGRHAPGETGRRDLALAAAHGMLLGHGLALTVLKANAPRAKVGIVLDLKPYYPFDDSQGCEDAAHRADGVFNRWFLDAIFRGSYPEDIVRGFGAAMPQIKPDDMEIIGRPVDCLGVNYYSRGLVRHDAGAPYPRIREKRLEGASRTAMDWEIYPEGLFDILLRLKEEYGVKDLFIAENGAAFTDKVVEGKIDDNDRVEYLRGHFEAAARAMDLGVPLSAYFVWSFLDNFEWGHGYTKRFGLCYVDYDTQRRIPKASALWYRNFIALNS
jgi:beta-glucosidase